MQSRTREGDCTDMRSLLAEILAAWRRADRLAETLPFGTAEHRAAVTASRRLQALYKKLSRPIGVDDALTDQEAAALLADVVRHGTI